MKKMLAITGAAVMTLAMATTAFAAENAAPNRPDYNGFGCGRGGMRAMLTDENGNFISAEAFANKVDAAVEAGYLGEKGADLLDDLYGRMLENDGNGFGRGFCRRGR